MDFFAVRDQLVRWKPFAARHAAFSANLVCFAVLLADGPVHADELAGGPSPVGWRQLSLLWRSQLDSPDRSRLWHSFRVAWRYDADPTWLEVRLVSIEVWWKAARRRNSPQQLRTVREDLPILAAIVASVTEAAGRTTARFRLSAWDDEVRDHGHAWPEGAEEVFRRAFAARGLLLPEWVGGLVSHGRSKNEVE